MKSVNKFLLKVIITYRLLFVSEFIDFMISSEDVSASQRLKCSLDIFFLLGISLINSVVATVAVCLMSEAVVRRCCIKKMFLKISQISHENTCARASFSKKLQASGLQIYLKRDSGTGVFLWNF